MRDPADPRPLFDISGRVVVVTGATGGLGAVMATGLGRCGARVVVTGRSATVAHGVVEDIRDNGGEAVAAVTDITGPEGRDTVVGTAVDAFGGVDILVNGAGVARRKAAAQVTSEDYEQIHALNAEAAFFLAQAAFPYLRASGRGSVVNVLSTGLWTGGSGSLLYRSSKAALQAMTMVLAREWAPEGVRVNALAPGAMDSGMGAGLDPERSARHLERTPQGRLGRAEELVPAVLYLASDASSFVTGTTLRVDGGAISL